MITEKLVFFVLKSIHLNNFTFTLKNTLRLNSIFIKPCKMANLLDPPDCVSGMKTLKREDFNKTITVPCLIVKSSTFSKLGKHLKDYFLKVHNLKMSQSCNVKDSKKILLNPLKITKWDDFSENVRSVLNSVEVTEKNLFEEEVILTYDNWNADVILKAILPKDKESVSGFSSIGHIIHLNLRDHFTEYKTIIGQVLLDKIKTAKTVVNKTHEIDNTYRNFEMELLCGENNFMVQVRQCHFVYEFDFSNVYWNPRLCTEHSRIVDLLKPNDVLIDVFAGVGPFSIPAAKKQCRVYANDLNPHSFKWLNHNIKLNKIQNTKVYTFNKNASDFIKIDVKTILLDVWKNIEGDCKVHVTMNLPASALEFIKYFQNLISVQDINNYEIIKNHMPFIHVYFFVKGEDVKKIALEHFYEVTGIKENETKAEIHYVRNVSANKDMMRVSFQIPVNFLIDTSISEPPSKKLCLEDS